MPSNHFILHVLWLLQYVGNFCFGVLDLGALSPLFTSTWRRIMPEQARYAWLASKLTEQDMFLVRRAREASPQRTTISALIADAVREAFGHLAAKEEAEPAKMKEAA